MKRFVVVLMAAAGCSQGTARGPKDPAAPATGEEVASAPAPSSAPAPVTGAVPGAAPVGLAPDEPEFWKDGVKRCEGVGKLYEYADAFGCAVERDDGSSLSLRFDGQGRLLGIDRFGKKQPGDDSSLLEGISVETYPGGGRMIEQVYHRGVADGPTVHYHPSGAKALEGRFVADKAEGRFVGWDGSGKQLGSFEMKGGTGEWIEWHPDGKPKLKKVLAGGKEHGEHREWFEDGSPKLQLRYERGEPIGPEKKWQRPNVLQHEGTWGEGGKVGTWKIYGKDGQLAQLETYAGGLLRWVAPHRGGKPVGALGNPGKCATDLEGEVRKQQKRELRNACVREPQLFPGVVVISDMVSDLGCKDPVAYADCNLRQKLDGTALLARAGWAKAEPALREALARAYVLEVALQGRSTDEPEITVDAKGVTTVRLTVQPRIGMRGAIGEPTPATFVISPTGKVTQN